MSDPPRTDAALAIEVARSSGMVTVRPSGEIDMANARLLQDALLAEIRDEPAVLVVDLEPVRFLASMGLSVLALADRTARDSGVEMRVVASRPIILRTLEVTGLVDEFAVFGSYGEAVAGKRSTPVRSR